MIKFKDECLNAGMVVHLRTEEQADAFGKWLAIQDEKWCAEGRYIDKGEWYVYKSETHYCPYIGSYGNRYDYVYEGYTTLSYEEVLLEDEEYTTPNLTDIIDLNKCKDYYVNEPHDIRIMYNMKRKGLFIHNKQLYCYYKNDPTMPLKPYTDFKEVECVEESTKELTIEEIQKELGYKIKIVEK